MQRKIDVQSVLDNARFGAFHWMLLSWCALIVVFDGYDLVIYGVVLPVLMKQWGMTPIEAGALGSYALFGMAFGALSFGSLSDRIGRKNVITICVVLFSGFTVLNGFSRNPMQFGLCRFAAGLGIGGVIPNVVALVTEYSPKRMRSLLVVCMLSGYSIGGMLSAGLGIVLLPRFGWQAVFYLAVIPLLLLPVIIRLLPESVGFLLRKNREPEVRKLLVRIQPNLANRSGEELHMAVPVTRRAPILELFQHGRALSTVMLWVAFFCCLLMVYALNSWLPKLMVSAGYGLGSSLLFLMTLNFGAIFGAIGGGWIGDRMNLRRVVVAFFMVAAVSIGLLGFQGPTWSLYALIAIAGATTIGTQILAYACVAQFYPTAIRSTGLGWASGVGRCGAILGPVLGGALVGWQIPLQLNFLAFAVPGVIAAIAMCLVKQSASAEETASAVVDGSPAATASAATVIAQRA